MIKLPKDPVHLHEVRLWSVGSNGVRAHRYVYHVFTKWKDYAPDRGPGADLENNWMVYEDESDTASGRLGGWNAMQTMPPEWWDWRFDRYSDALRAFIKLWREKLKRMRQQVATAKSQLDAARIILEQIRGTDQ